MENTITPTVAPVAPATSPAQAKPSNENDASQPVVVPHAKPEKLTPFQVVPHVKPEAKK